MPASSKAQMRYLWSQVPSVAREFADKMSKKDYKKLPEHVRKKKRRKRQ